ncbi:MAG: GNAT family N-acetyltransferase [Acidobacteria bacterium]|nr:GNAT family N-acetyltransferase [Acidobacteriota bacterium]
MFCSIELAARVERAAAALVRAGAESARAHHAAGANEVFVLPLAGGIAAWASAGSPLNKVAGLGFGGVPSAGDLDAVERAFAARATPVQVELANLAEPALATLLSDRGYRLVGFENVLGTRLPRPPAPPVGGVSVSRIAPDELPTWLDTVIAGFAAPDTQGVASHEEFPREVLERAVGDLARDPAYTSYLARLQGEIAGGAAVHVFDGVAQLAGAATLPRYRRRGVQTALLAARLADVAAAGCEIAVITTQPGSKSQQNAQKQGFHLLYTRAVLVRS